MQDDGGTLARLGATLPLAALPFAWVVWNRGPRRDHAGERALDGWLLLGALAVALFALLMGGASLVRRAREARVAAEWPQVQARVAHCVVAERRAAGRQGVRTHELSCVVQVDSAGQPVARTVTAGYVTRRAAYAGWIAEHPPGSVIALRRHPTEPGVVDGLARRAGHHHGARGRGAVAPLRGGGGRAVRAVEAGGRAAPARVVMRGGWGHDGAGPGTGAPLHPPARRCA